MKSISFVLALLIGVSLSAARDFVDMSFTKGKEHSEDNLCVVIRDGLMLSFKDAAGE